MSQTQWIVVGIGIGAVVLGIVLVVLGVLARKKLAAIKETPTVSAGQAGQMSEACRVEVVGQADSPAPLTSPATGTPCLYYRHRVEQLERQWRTDSQGHGHYDDNWRTVVDTKNHANFVVRDESGEVTVLPDGAEFVAQQTMNGSYGSLGYEPSRSTGSGVLDTVLDAVDGIGRGARSFRTYEWVVPLNAPVYVHGCVYQTPTGTQLRKGEGPFIISYKTEEQLLKRYSLHSILYLVFGVLCGGGGIAAIIYGSQFMEK